MSEFIKKHKFDIILMGILLLAISIAVIIFASNQSDGAYAVVIENGKETATYPLDTNIRVSLANGENYNVLVIEDNTARIESASCPDKLCVNQHTVSKNGQSLVCLPNKVVVKIVSEIDSETDFIS